MWTPWGRQVPVLNCLSEMPNTITRSIAAIFACTKTCHFKKCVQLNCCPANKLGGLAKAGGPGLVTAGGGAGQKLGGPGPPRPHSWLRPCCYLVPHMTKAFFRGLLLRREQREKQQNPRLQHQPPYSITHWLFVCRTRQCHVHAIVATFIVFVCLPSPRLRRY